MLASVHEKKVSKCKVGTLLVSRWERVIFSKRLLVAANHSLCTVAGGRCVSAHHGNQGETERRRVVATPGFQNFHPDRKIRSAGIFCLLDESAV